MAHLIDLNEDRGLDPTKHAEMMIKDDPRTGGDLLRMKDRYPNAYRRLFEKDGWRDADGRFARLSVFSAEAMEAVWGGHAIGITEPCMARNAIRAYGEYLVNYPAPKHMGRWEGAGPHQGWHQNHAALTLQTWKGNWLGSDPHQMACFLSTGFGINSNEGWLHGCYFGGIGLKGNNSGWYDPSYTEYGVRFWDEAEASTIGSIWAADFNGFGVEFVRGTPAHCTGTISSFTNALGGIALSDGELGTMHLGLVSGDDNPALIVMRSKYGRGAGGMVSFTLVKSESGKRTPNKGQVVLWQQDPCVGCTTINMVQADMNFRDLHAPFVMKSRDWGQTLMVNGFVGWNQRAVLHDVTNSKHWPRASYNPLVFGWTSQDGGILTDVVRCQRLTSEPVNASDRLGTVPVGGAYDFVNGLPRYDILGGQATVAPVVRSFTCEPSTAAGGAAPLLRWDVGNATDVTITGVPGTQQPIGSFQLPQVLVSTTYTLTARGNGGTTTATTTLTVTPALKPGQDRTKWLLTTFASVAGNPSTAALDASPGSFWHSGVSMQDGQQIVLDLGAVASGVAGIEWDVPTNYPNDFPTLFDAHSSTDRNAWSKWNATPVSGGSTCRVVPTQTSGVSARYLRITNRYSRGSWWGIRDIRVIFK